MELITSSSGFVLAWGFAVACLAIMGLRPLAATIGLVDKPSARKQHMGNVPLVGGIAVYFAVLVVTQLFIADSQLLNLYLISCSFMVFIGAVDDYYDISARFRLVAQLLIASILVWGAGYALNDMGNIFGIGNVQLGLLALPVTLLAVATAINAFNMTDGIDGLVGLLGCVTFASLSVLFYFAGSKELFVISAVFVSALAAFLLFNLGGLRRIFGKIFMGDAGSMLIGLSVVWMLVLGSQGEKAAFRPVTALWLIAVPLMDMFAVMHRRVKKGKSPLSADRDHIHHICMRLGLSSRQALVVISGIASLFAGLGLLGEYFQVPEVIMLAGFVVVFVAYDYLFMHSWRVTRWLKRA